MNITLTSTTPQELSQEFQAAIAQLQQKITADIQQAQAEGDMMKLQQLTLEMQRVTQELSQQYEKRMEEAAAGSAAPVAIYDNSLCGVSLEELVYDGDRDYILQFRKDQEISRCRQEMEENNGEINSRRALLKSSLRLTPLLAPKIYEIGNHCKEVLGLNMDIEFYTYQNTRFNASCYPPGDNRLYIMLTSALLENFSEGELAFVIGHEIGHALFDHFAYSAGHMMELGSDYLSPLHAMKLFAWERSAEISADRIGLLCCGDYEVAAKTFFKLSSGITSSTVEFQLNEYVKQFVDLEEEINTGDVDPEDWYSTHPFGPLRIKALHLFHMSETYHSVLKQKGGSLTEEQMEQKIQNILSLMEPKYLDADCDNGALIQEFIFLSGYLIALSDGEVAPQEIQALGSLTEPEVFKRCIEQVQQADTDDLKEILTERSQEVNRLLSPIQKLNIIKDLAVICFADDSLDEEEVNILYGLCHLLRVSGEFADRVLHDLQESQE